MKAEFQPGNPRTNSTASVSVVMLANGRPQYLRQAIASVLLQSHRRFELIIVQDLENGAVRGICESAAANDSRIKYIKRTLRGSIAQASNFAIRVASTDYVAIIDDDDMWASPEKLGDQLAFLESRPDCVAVGGGVVVIDENGKEIARYLKPCTHEDIARKALVANPVANSTAMFRRAAWEKVGGYDESLSQFHDWDFWLKMLHAGRIYNIREFYLLYTLWPNGVSSSQIAGTSASALTIVARHRAAFPHGTQAMAYARLYRMYACLPQWLRSRSYTTLSCLKKRYIAPHAAIGAGDKADIDRRFVQRCRNWS